MFADLNSSTSEPNRSRPRSTGPRLARFLQPDPIGYEGGPNLYAYAAGDPINRTDPSGTRDCGLESNWRSGGCDQGNTRRLKKKSTDGGKDAEKSSASGWAGDAKVSFADFGPAKEFTAKSMEWTENDILITFRGVQFAQLDIDMRTPLQRMDDNLGITKTVRAGVTYLRSCAAGLGAVNPERAAVAASRGGIRGSVAGATRGAVLGSPMGPPGSGWGATGGAVTGTLGGAATGAAGSVVKQACEAGNAE